MLFYKQSGDAVESTNVDGVKVLTITNEFTLPENNSKDVEVTIKWTEEKDSSSRPESVKLVIVGTKEYEATVTADGSTDSNVWTYTFEDLPKYNADGEEIEYVVK